MVTAIKHLFDKIISSVLLLFISPLLLIIALLIKLSSKGPVIFKQFRSGQNGKVFNIYKFRTMVVDAEKKGAGVFVEENDTRITRVGRFLRHTSLDELPQLINVLKGEMSLVGPRPTLPYQVANYDERQKKRLNVKPGVTGWAQVNGRSALTWPERIELDLWYVNNWSLWLDLKIIFKTFGVVLVKSNLYKKAGYDPISGQTPSGSNKKDDFGNDNQ